MNRAKSGSYNSSETPYLQSKFVWIYVNYIYNELYLGFFYWLTFEYVIL